MKPLNLGGLIVIALLLSVTLYSAGFAQGLIPMPPAPPVLQPHQGETVVIPFVNLYRQRAISAWRALINDLTTAPLPARVELSAKDINALNEQGIQLQQAGRFKEAIDVFTHYIELRPNETTGYVNRGNSYCDSGNQQLAFADFDKARQLDDKDEIAWLGIGRTYLHSGDAKGSLQFTTKAIELNPNDHWAWNNRAIAYRALGEYDKAMSDENEAIKYAPLFGHHYFKRGLIYKSLGNNDEMEKDFATARQLGFDVDGYLRAEGETR